MRVTLGNRIVAIAAGAVIAAGAAQALATHAGAGSSPAGDAVRQAATSAAAQAATIRYWTTSRMAAALRASAGPPTAKPSTRYPGSTAANALRPAQLVQPAKPAQPAERHAPRSLVKHLVKKAAPSPAARRAPAPQGPWLTGNTTGSGLRWTHGGTVADAVGKVFFTLNDVDYVCSGALVGGARPDVVLTAAHCVTGGRGPNGTTAWATNWMFIPGYSDGQAPYGEYTARRFFATSDWSGPTGGHEQYDVAFVQIATSTLHGGLGAASPPPGLPVRFAASQDAVPASQAYVFGYPSLPPYTGLYPDYCAGPVTASRGSLRTSCAMTAGDSGGPWLAGFSPQPGSGTIVAVSTYKVSSNLSVLYGAVLGPQARTLYAQAVSPVR
ncbi:MAG TPA: serine protease [Trebonia sp.]|nr:serine protease [Trebonia sp.]